MNNTANPLTVCQQILGLTLIVNPWLWNWSCIGSRNRLGQQKVCVLFEDIGRT